MTEERPPPRVRPARFIGSLRRRAAFLAERVRRGDANYYERYERHALEWAIQTLEKNREQR